MRKYVLALAAFLTPVLLSFPVYASDGGFSGGQQGGGRDSVADTKVLVSAMDDLVDVMGQVWAFMVANPLLVVLVAASLFTLGVRIFRKAKGAAKG